MMLNFTKDCPCPSKINFFYLYFFYYPLFYRKYYFICLPRVILSCLDS